MPTPPEPQAVAAAVVTSPRGVLAGRRVDGRPPWTFPGGKLEAGETPAAAAMREVREETGLVVAVRESLGERVHPLAARRMIYLACEPIGDTDVQVAAPHELAEVRWLSTAEADELLAGTYPPVRLYVAAAAARHGF